MQERLRRKLRRSPEPEEIRFEMARDKGYGGRSRSKKMNDNIMHADGSSRQLSLQRPQINESIATSYKDGSLENNMEFQQDDSYDELNVATQERSV